MVSAVHPGCWWVTKRHSLCAGTGIIAFTSSSRRGRPTITRKWEGFCVIHLKTKSERSWQHVHDCELPVRSTQTWAGNQQVMETWAGRRGVHTAQGVNVSQAAMGGILRTFSKHLGGWYCWRESRPLANEGSGGVNYVLKLPEILRSWNSSSAENHQENKFGQLGGGGRNSVKIAWIIKSR